MTKELINLTGSRKQAFVDAVLKIDPDADLSFLDGEVDPNMSIWDRERYVIDEAHYWEYVAVAMEEDGATLFEACAIYDFECSTLAEAREYIVKWVSFFRFARNWYNFYFRQISENKRMFFPTDIFPSLNDITDQMIHEEARDTALAEAHHYVLYKKSKRADYETITEAEANAVLYDDVFDELLDENSGRDVWTRIGDYSDTEE
jgi:hypothetical protein